MDSDGGIGCGRSCGATYITWLRVTVTVTPALWQCSLSQMSNHEWFGLIAESKTRRLPLTSTPLA